MWSVDFEQSIWSAIRSVSPTAKVYYSLNIFLKLCFFKYITILNFRYQAAGFISAVQWTRTYRRRGWDHCRKCVRFLAMAADC